MADGLILPGTPESVGEAYMLAQESWEAEGRTGRPRLVGAAYYALGANADRGVGYIRDYYSFMGPAVEFLAGSILTTTDGI